MAKLIVKLPFQIVKELGLPWNAKHESHVETNDHGDATYEIVFEYDGRLLATTYTQTRIDGIYWDYDMEEKRPETIECVVVRPVEKVVVAYIPIEEPPQKITKPPAIVDPNFVDDVEGEEEVD